jgi:tripartite-type tricarboxylate transporter receptor subunit TctC
MNTPATAMLAAFRRSLATAAMAVLAVTAVGNVNDARAADAGAYPDRPIRLIVPFGAGSQMDIAGRLVAGKLATAVGQSVVVENHIGGSGNIASELVAKSAPDGYTLLITGSLITLLPSTLGARAVDPVTSFAAVTKLAEPPILILVHPTLNVSTLPELVELAQRQPGKIAYATAGVGTVQHLVATVISRKAGIELLHVPYANAGQMLKDVLRGEVPVFFTFSSSAIDGYLRNGELRGIAVASNRRVPAWPDLPTVVELGYREAAADPWNGIVAPAGTPPEIVDRLYREFARIVQMPDVRERFLQMGMVPLATSPAEFSTEIREAVVRWPPIVKAAGIRPD